MTLAKIVEQNNIFEYILNAAEEKFVVSAGGLPKFDYATYKVVNQKLKDLGFKFQEYQGHFYEKTWFQVIPASKLSILTETCRDFCTPSVVKVIPPPDEVKALARSYGMAKQDWVLQIEIRNFFEKRKELRMRVMKDCELTKTESCLGYSKKRCSKSLLSPKLTKLSKQGFFTLTKSL